MAQFAVPLMVASTILSTAGMIQQAGQQKFAGKVAQRNAEMQQQALENQALQLDQRAGQERAVAQREAIEQRRQGRLAASRGQAVAAASGAGALDPGVVDLLGDIEGEGEYRALVAKQAGEERARTAEMSRDFRRFEGATALQAGRFARKQANLAARGSMFKAGAALAGGAFDTYRASRPGALGDDFEPTFNTKYGSL